MEPAIAMSDDTKVTQPPEATWTIVLENIGLVHKIANTHCRNHQDRDDLVQEGLIGLFEAARRFDPSYGAAFGTFAYPYIRGYILRYFQDRPEEEQLKSRKSAEASVGEDQPQDFGMGAAKIPIADTWLDSAEVDYIRQDLGRHLRERLEADLDELERLIVAVRWLGDDKLTFDEIAKTLGISRQRVEQLESAAFAKLRRGLSRRQG